MVSTMKAVRFHGQKDLRLEDIPVPTLKKGFVKVRPAWVGICGSDLHEYLGGPTLTPTTPHPITGDQVPLVFGHEFSGVIEEVGEGITKFKPGERVCVQPIIYDGTCGACKEGLINCCYSNGFIGLSGWGGGLSEHCVVPEYSLYKLPENVSLEVGALIEPLSVGWHAVNLSSFKAGDSVLVLGGGPIGLAVIQALVARGKAEKIIVSEVSSQRKAYARQFGATHIIDPLVENVRQRCQELCEGQGVHVVFDCAGVQAGLDEAVHAVRARGTIVNVAIWEKPCTINPNVLVFKERKYLGVATYMEGDFQQVLDAISEGRMSPERMITKKIRLDQVEEEGFQALIRDKENQVKVLVEVDSL
ncbi:chaperonin 10-like protein [Lineolata rhizophorae]|uniref:Chaperonin 10-like protein n=1 Tax=Lineolata rhizophorae TaxID=578093 RepID=A0A6A6P9Q3_9PEZI|nr:chaperonin 10-like protein [Lineolata rhizophorae]